MLLIRRHYRARRQADDPLILPSEIVEPSLSSHERCADRLPRLTLRSRLCDAKSVALAFSGRSFAGRDRRLQVLEAEIELIAAELLRFATEVIAPEAVAIDHHVDLGRKPAAGAAHATTSAAFFSLFAAC